MQTKPRYMSKTIRGAIIVLVHFVLNQAWVDISTEELEPVVDAIINIIGVVLVIIGRASASTRLTVK